MDDMPAELRVLINQTKNAAISGEADRRVRMYGLTEAIFNTRTEAKFLIDVYADLESRET